MMKKEEDKNRIVVITSIFVVGAIVILATMSIGNFSNAKHQRTIKDTFGPYKIISEGKTTYFGETVSRYEIEVEDSFEECDNVQDKIRVFYMNGKRNLLPVLEEDVRERYSEYGTIERIEKRDAYSINYLCETQTGYDMCSCSSYNVFVVTINLNEPFTAQGKSHDTMIGVVSIYGNKVYEGYI